jgi:hypothetical protein
LFPRQDSNSNGGTGAIPNKAYVVYVYGDYRKEIGTRCIRTYKDKAKAIEFAESLSTKFNFTDGEKYEDSEIEYCLTVGNVFDAALMMSNEHLPALGGIWKEWDIHAYMNRVGVDETDMH